MFATDMHTPMDLVGRQDIASALPTSNGFLQARIQKRVATSSVVRTSLMATQQFRTQFVLSHSRNVVVNRATNGQSGISTYRVNLFHLRANSDRRC
jgi:hypothetical protein